MNECVLFLTILHSIYLIICCVFLGHGGRYYNELNTLNSEENKKK
jgi:hypothetical protein